MSHRLLGGDVLEMLATLPDESVQTTVTSPPYWGLRDYGVEGQIGLEPTPEEYVAKIVSVFREVRRVLRKDGTLWLNLGDTYASNWPCNRRNVVGTGSLENGKRENRPPRMGEGLKDKDLVGIPWMVAFALRADGWYLRSDIIWHKPNPMPESVRDRPTKSHEYVFLLSKSEKYYYDADAISEKANYPGGAGNMENCKYVLESAGDPRMRTKSNIANIGGRETRNKRTVWNIATTPFADAHFATFPEELPRLCILAGSKEGDVVLDSFAGSGTTLAVAEALGRDSIGIEINPEYRKLIAKRMSGVTPAMRFLEPV